MPRSKAKPSASRTIEHVPLVDLIPNPANPKAHDTSVIDQSVGRFGFVEPIVVDGRTGRIISGHGRAETLRVMEQRGQEPPEGITADEDGRWLIPTVVGWSSRSDTEANAALIALNRAGELGGWADDALLEILDELSDLDDGYSGVGFTEKDREDLARLVAETPDLDRLGDEWDGSGINDSAKPTTIKLTTAETITAWQTHRAAFESDDEALDALLDSAGA